MKSPRKECVTGSHMRGKRISKKVGSRGGKAGKFGRKEENPAKGIAIREKDKYCKNFFHKVGDVQEDQKKKKDLQPRGGKKF